MEIRAYTPRDCGAMALLFYDTVHTVNARDYTKEQLCAWAGGDINLEQWSASFLSHSTLVAEENGTIAGFADMDNNGCLDRLFVHKGHQGQGIATALVTRLEQQARKIGISAIETYASITARTFFEQLGYTVRRKNTAIRHGVPLVNYFMTKVILFPLDGEFY